MWIIRLLRRAYRAGILTRGYARMIGIIVRMFKEARWVEERLVVGPRIVLDLSEPSCIPIFLRGYLAIESERFLRIFAKRWTCFYDVGAHIGIMSIIVANENPDCMCLAFEPTPRLFSVLERQSTIYPNIKPIQAAVGEIVGHTSLYLSNSGVFNSTTRPSVKKHSRSLVDVKQINLDSYLGSESQIPDLIKVDVEGGEYEVIAGSKNLLASDNPPAWFIEVNTSFLSERGIDYFDIERPLARRGYRSFAWNAEEGRLESRRIIGDFRGNILYLPQKRFYLYEDYIGSEYA